MEKVASEPAMKNVLWLQCTNNELVLFEMSTDVVEVTPRRILGYVLLALGIIVWFVVVVMGMLLATGVIQPLKVPNLDYGFDVIFGMGLQLGVYTILVGIGAGLAKAGVDLVKD